MSENTAPDAGGQDNAPYQAPKPVVPWAKWKTVLLVVFALAAVGLTINSSVVYERNHKAEAKEVRPPPTYTGEAPLSINSMAEAWDSNNDFVIVVTPSSDAAASDAVINIAVQAANKIRSTDRIYVGVFLLPVNDSLTGPTATIRMLNTTTASFQETMRTDITEDSIYQAYLDRKYLRSA